VAPSVRSAWTSPPSVRGPASDDAPGHVDQHRPRCITRYCRPTVGGVGMGRERTWLLVSWAQMAGSYVGPRSSPITAPSHRVRNRPIGSSCHRDHPTWSTGRRATRQGALDRDPGGSDRPGRLGPGPDRGAGRAEGRARSLEPRHSLGYVPPCRTLRLERPLLRYRNPSRWPAIRVVTNGARGPPGT